MANFPTIVQAYIELGILGLLAVIFIFLVIIAFGRKGKDDDWKKAKIDKKDEILESDKQTINKQLQELTKIILTQNEEMRKIEKERQDSQNKVNEKLASKIIDGVIYHIPSQEENSKLTNVNIDIDTILQDILLETNASRVSVVQYHNGGKGINKQAFLKMSMTNEKIQLGVKPFIQDFKDQFRSVLGYFVNEINTKGFCYINNVDDILYKDVGMYEFMKNRGIESKYGYAIHNTEGNVVAFICVEFIDKVKADESVVNNSLKEHYREVERLLNS